jgi:MYXO-CTERM domain-containing protein
MGKRTDEDLGWVLVALAVFLARRRRRSSEGL